MKKVYDEIVKHYEQCLEKHGDSHLGVDWPNPEDADRRYKIMLDIIRVNEDNDNTVSLLDFGCGTAGLLDYINKVGNQKIVFSGLDISSKFVEVAQKKYPDNSFYCFDILDLNKKLPSFDYIVMNGVFTEKRGLTYDEMFDYFTKLLMKVMQFAKKGVAFNVMSKAVDWERDDLFHLPMDQLNEFLCKNLTRNFIIRNDYGLYEYTTYLYK